MKFIKGFFVGAGIGFAIGSNLSDQRRRELVERTRAAVRRQARPVRDAAGSAADRVTDATTGAVVASVERAGEAIVDAVDAAAPESPEPAAAVGVGTRGAGVLDDRS